MLDARRLLAFFPHSADTTLVRLLERIEEESGEELSSTLLISYLGELIDHGLVTAVNPPADPEPELARRNLLRGKLRLTPDGETIRAAMRASKLPSRLRREFPPAA